ncbi:TRAP C4-dicarboxylate transport system subunit DctQ [Celeribacter indicus]|uniref:TRAP transporter small permease protein n=1 Tax=Celeribacter indicus TaxID=1208324 RepID=A0A0B5E5B3_9RHOB|nr:TRAP C4-dicarboxylate transport system subunit DctQ [Celeribacter indicus]
MSATSQALALVGGLCILAIVVLTVAEVVSRRLTGRSLGPVDELSSYLFAAGIALSLAWALDNRAHIRIDILYARLPRGMRTASDILALLSLTAFAAVLLARGWQVFAISWASGSRSASTLGLPLVLPQGVWLAGIAIFLAALLCQCVAALLALLRRRPDWIARHLSPPNVDELVAEETRDLPLHEVSDR